MLTIRCLEGEGLVHAERSPFGPFFWKRKMAIERDITFDFRGDGIKSYLTDPKFPAEYSESEAIIADWTTRGYRFVNERDIGVSQKMAMRSFRTCAVSVFTPADRLLEVSLITDPIDHDVSFRISAILLVKAGLSADKVDQLTKFFIETALDDIDHAETDAIRAGFSVDEYQVCLVLKFTRLSSPSISKINLDTYCKQISQCKDREGRAYRAVPSDNFTFAYDLPSNAFNDEHILLVKNLDDPSAEIQNRGTKERPVFVGNWKSRTTVWELCISTMNGKPSGSFVTYALADAR
jgi:hypothetical protein